MALHFSFPPSLAAAGVRFRIGLVGSAMVVGRQDRSAGVADVLCAQGHSEGVCALPVSAACICCSQSGEGHRHVGLVSCLMMQLSSSAVGWIRPSPSIPVLLRNECLLFLIREVGSHCEIWPNRCNPSPPVGLLRTDWHCIYFTNY